MAVIGDRAVLTPGAAGGEKSARVPAFFSWLILPGGGIGNLRCAPQISPRKDKSTALRATHSPAKARKRSPKVKGPGVPRNHTQPPRRRHGPSPTAPLLRPDFCFKNFGDPEDRGVFFPGFFLGCKTVRRKYGGQVQTREIIVVSTYLVYVGQVALEATLISSGERSPRRCRAPDASSPAINIPKIAPTESAASSHVQCTIVCYPLRLVVS